MWVYYMWARCGKVPVFKFEMEFLAVGVVIFVVEWVFVTWAIVENKFFETTVHIQKEKDHRVVTTGPYAIVRHPGYVGMILFYGCTPFIIGSFYGLIPALLLVISLVFRTYFKDRMLYEGLSGYQDIENIRRRQGVGLCRLSGEE
jgi:Putative protein-S-isoprenylcysteine methyltransferase